MKKILCFFTTFLFVVTATVILLMPEMSAKATITETWTGNEGNLYYYHKHTKGEGIPIIVIKTLNYRKFEL